LLQLIRLVVALVFVGWILNLLLLFFDVVIVVADCSDPMPPCVAFRMDATIPIPVAFDQF